MTTMIFVYESKARIGEIKVSVFRRFMLWLVKFFSFGQLCLPLADWRVGYRDSIQVSLLFYLQSYSKLTYN